MGIPCKSVLGGGSGLVPGGLQFFWGSPIFRGVSNFSGGGISTFFGDTPTHPPPQDLTPEYSQRSAGTHPTGMHSCFGIFLVRLTNSEHFWFRYQVLLEWK